MLWQIAGGDLNGRPRAPSYPPPGAVPVSIVPGDVGMDQTTEVVDPHSVTVEQAVSMAKMEEEADVIEDIGLIRDVNLANTVYTIPEVSLEYTPTLEADSVRTDSEADSDVSIEPYMAQGDDYQVEEEAPDEPMPAQTGEPVETILWPPRVLESQPLTFLLRDVRDPVLEPGTPGVAASNISPISTVGSENILFEPVLSVEDTALVAEVDAAIPDLFIKSLAGSYKEGTIRCIMDVAETYPDRPAGMYDVARGQCRSLSESRSEEGSLTCRRHRQPPDPFVHLHQFLKTNLARLSRQHMLFPSKG